VELSLTDVGKLFVQVKSSRGGKAAFLERRRSARIAVVVVRVTDSRAPHGCLFGASFASG
jgi:hypothetical protein